MCVCMCDYGCVLLCARRKMTSSVWEEDVEAAIIALKASPTARTEAQIQHLMDWMQHVPFFATNAKSQAAKSSICRALCYESYPKSVPIMRQGESPVPPIERTRTLLHTFYCTSMPSMPAH
eukprot:COSAG05_NODE_225_length_13597_cov_18.878723_3_plen_121_part_00